MYNHSHKSLPWYHLYHSASLTKLQLILEAYATMIKNEDFRIQLFQFVAQPLTGHMTTRTSLLSLYLSFCIGQYGQQYYNHLSTQNAISKCYLLFMKLYCFRKDRYGFILTALFNLLLIFLLFVQYKCVKILTSYFNEYFFLLFHMQFLTLTSIWNREK